MATKKRSKKAKKSMSTAARRARAKAAWKRLPKWKKDKIRRAGRKGGKKRHR